MCNKTEEKEVARYASFTHHKTFTEADPFWRHAVVRWKSEIWNKENKLLARGECKNSEIRNEEKEHIRVKGEDSILFRFIFFYQNGHSWYGSQNMETVNITNIWWQG